MRIPRAVKHISFYVGVLVVLGLALQNCGKGLKVGEIPSQGPDPQNGDTKNPDLPASTPVPDLSGFTNFNPNQTTGAKIGYWEYNMPVRQFLNRLYPSSVTAGPAGKVYVASACGVFASQDNAETFKLMSLPGIEDRPLPNAFFVDGSTIYIGTSVGLYVSRDGGVSFQNILDTTKARTAVLANPDPCVSISVGLNLYIFSVYASGSDIFVGTGVGLLVSHDGGATFGIPVMSSGGYYLPPVSLVTSIASANGKIFLAAGNGSGAAARFNTALVGTNTCAINPQLPNYGLLVSTDNGVSFSAIGNAAISGLSLRAAGADVYAVVNGHLNAGGTFGTGVTHSADGGVTFSDTTLETASFGQEVVPIALSGNDLFTANNSPNNFSILARSADKGVTFSNVLPDPKIPVGYSYVTSLASQGANFYVMTDRGLYISNDNGATYSGHRTFSSNFCTYPWWSNIANTSTAAAASNGNELYFLMSLSSIGRSTDGGKSFSLTSVGGGNGIELFASSSATYFNRGSGQNMIVSLNKGTSFGAAVTTAADGTSGATVSVIPQSPYGLYVSSDGTNQLTQVTNNIPGALVSSAYSVGNRIVAGIFGQGLVVYQNGSSIYTNPNIKQNSSPQYIRVRYVNGVFFAVGDRLWASYDNGTTFSIVPGAPHFPQDVYASGTSIYALEGGYLYVSRDGGHNFTPWTAELR